MLIRRISCDFGVDACLEACQLQYNILRAILALVQGLAVPCWRAHLCHQQAPPLLSVAPSRRCTAPLVPEGFWASDLNSDLSGPGLAPDLESSLGLRCGVVPGCCQGLETEVSTSSSFEDAVGSFE
jgi:hypothetical protein